jgi:hypothetical protein
MSAMNELIHAIQMDVPIWKTPVADAAAAESAVIRDRTS